MRGTYILYNYNIVLLIFHYIMISILFKIQKVLDGKPPDENVLKELKLNLPNERLGLSENSEKVVLQNIHCRMYVIIRLV